MAVNSCRRASSIKKSIFNRLSRHNAKVHRRGPRCQPTKGSRRKLRCFVHLAYALSHTYHYQHVIYIQLNRRVIGRVLDTLAILKDPCLYYCIFLSRAYYWCLVSIMLVARDKILNPTINLPQIHREEPVPSIREAYKISLGRQ